MMCALIEGYEPMRVWRPQANMELRWQVVIKDKWLLTYRGNPMIEDLMIMFRCSEVCAATIKVEGLPMGQIWELFEMINSELDLEDVHLISKETQFANALADFYAKN